MKIDKGITRTVFVFKNKVLKIPTFREWRLFLHGMIANINEGDCYKNLSKREDLAEVYYYNKLGIFLIMERVNVCDNNEWYSLLELLKEKYKDDELKELFMSDYKPGNWGRRSDGTFVKIDYGD